MGLLSVGVLVWHTRASAVSGMLEGHMVSASAVPLAAVFALPSVLGHKESVYAALVSAQISDG